MCVSGPQVRQVFSCAGLCFARMLTSAGTRPVHLYIRVVLWLRRWCSGSAVARPPGLFSGASTAAFLAPLRLCTGEAEGSQCHGRRQGHILRASAAGERPWWLKWYSSWQAISELLAVVGNPATIVPDEVVEAEACGPDPEGHPYPCVPGEVQDFWGECRLRSQPGYSPSVALYRESEAPEASSLLHASHIGV